MIFGSLLPHQPHISQWIQIKIEDKFYVAWSASKWNYVLHGEIEERDGKKSKYYPMNLYCDIQAEQKYHNCGYREYQGIAILRQKMRS